MGIEYFIIVIYLLYGIKVSFDYWNKFDDNDKENAEKGTACIILLVITFLWPIKVIYSKVKKLL